MQLFFALLAFTIGLSLLTVMVGGVALFIFSVNSYPWGTFLLLPVLLGLFGTIGLYLAGTGIPTNKPAQRLHWEVALLVAGEAGALVFLFVSYGHFLPVPIASTLVVPTVIPALPMLMGIVLCSRSALALRAKTPSRGKAWRPVGLILLACAGLLIFRIGAQEAVMAWYGRNLVNAVYASADTIAGGREYCVIDRAGALRFEDLDRRSILQDAVVKRIGFQGMNTTWISAHFGIAVGDRAYWWSFRQREFLPFPRGIDSMLYSQTCPYHQ